MYNSNNNFALIIGVGGDQIEYTVNDAIMLHKNLTNKDLIGYPKENVILRTEEQATRKGILDAFDELHEKTDEDSTILLYYSGHGGKYLTKHKFFLQPSDMTADNVEETMITAEELKEKINALPSSKLVLFLDCCHAEGLVQSGIKGLYGMAQKLNDEQGIWLMASCQDNEKSYGGGDHSFFTQALLDVLAGRHVRPFTDPEISMMDVVEYIFNEVPKMASNCVDENNNEVVQTPYFKTQMSENLILSHFPKNAQDHERIIAELEPNLEALDEESFIRLIKSMEAVGRVEDAISALNKNKQTKSDPDLMETLGDLYRNYYIKHRLQKEGEEALEIYKRAYELAVKTEDEEQVFTNAVKVAFMLAKLDLSKKEMREYALLALSAADNYVYDSVPKFVTLAEASIYLGERPVFT
jgi:tetratricopeptide (TPR) repeat protein